MNSASLDQLDDTNLITGDYPDVAWFRSIRTKSLNWFKKHQRQLPWRTDNSVYRVWISEIMLQQTQVQTVVDYFNRFVQRFPTVGELATAPEPEVLSLWEGLGYYRRARSLHAAAKMVVRDFGGIFPENYDDVIALPGIGRYTAGAILSIALDQRLPILEGNTFRLHARLLGMTCDPRERSAEKLLWQFATDLLPGKRSKASSGQLNQALMEIGSKVCTAKNPLCSKCPLITNCAAHRFGMQDKIPRNDKKTNYEDRNQALFLLENEHSQFLVRKRREGEWWSGLWDFVRVEIENNNRTSNVASLAAKFLQQNLGIQIPSVLEPDFTLKHAVTKYRIRLDCFHIRQSAWPCEGDYQFKSLDQIDKLPLNVTARKAFNRVRNESAC